MGRSRTLMLTFVVFLLVSAAGVGNAAPRADLSLPKGATPLEGGGYAQELKAETPEWYTPELHSKVLRAGTRGVPVPEGASAEYSSLAFTGIRPGAWILFPAGCTTNFVFGSEGSYHIGTAGHCTSVGDEVTLVALPGVLMNIGRTVKSYDNGIGEDFALIEIYPEMQQYVNPSMSYFAGPTGTADPAFGDVVVHSGHGLVIGTGGTPRAGVVTYTGEGDGGAAFGWDGEAMLGDSGSAVRNATGPAAGNLTHLVVGTEYLPAFIAGTTAPYMEQLAGMSIATASLVPDPLW
ncbi:MAG TPA: hypothetical protein VFS18_04485 [Actinomycetota bacterium]|nr:hypothetical protein [Actinomycetota bacterium]